MCLILSLSTRNPYQSFDLVNVHRSISSRSTYSVSNHGTKEKPPSRVILTDHSDLSSRQYLAHTTRLAIPHTLTLPLHLACTLSYAAGITIKSISSGQLMYLPICPPSFAIIGLAFEQPLYSHHGVIEDFTSIRNDPFYSLGSTSKPVRISVSSHDPLRESVCSCVDRSSFLSAIACDCSVQRVSL